MLSFPSFPLPPPILTTPTDDGAKLFRDYHVAARNLVELGGLARQADPAFGPQHKRNVVSLARMVRTYQARDVDKNAARLSNWERVPLTEQQKTCTILPFPFCQCEPLIMVRRCGERRTLSTDGLPAAARGRERARERARARGVHERRRGRAGARGTHRPDAVHSIDRIRRHVRRRGVDELNCLNQHNHNYDDKHSDDKHRRVHRVDVRLARLPSQALFQVR